MNVGSGASYIVLHRHSILLFVISVNQLISLKYGELSEVGTLKSKPTVD